jgi:tRNA pseudouridine38-40 synthase
LELISNLIKALNESNKSELNNMLSDDLKGIRLTEQQVYYSKKDFLDVMPSFNFKVHTIEVKDGYAILSGEDNNGPRVGRIDLKDKIDKIYFTNDTGKKRVKCRIAYDGSRFYGFQKQQTRRSVQGELEAALSSIFNVPTKVIASGRTDRGVHALDQVIHFDYDQNITPENLLFVFNHFCPDDITVLSCEEVHPTFHARYDAISKTYMYVINKNEVDIFKRFYEVHFEDFDAETFKNTLNHCIGTYDFSSFTTTQEGDGKRTIHSINFIEDEHVLKVFIKGSGFMRYMVRYLVMAAHLISSSQLTISMRELIELKDNTILKDKAPAEGLYLYAVEYK